MSGNITTSYASNDDADQRYREMVERIRSNNTVSLNSQTMSESRVGASVNNSTQQPGGGNSVLTTQQFYNTSTVNNRPNHEFLPPKPPSTYSHLSVNTGAFQMPQTTKQYSTIAKYRARMEYANRSFFNIEDRSMMKLVMRIYEESINIVRLTPQNNKNPAEVMNTLFNTVNEKYYLHRLPISVAGSTTSSFHSDSVFVYNPNTQSSLLSRPPSTASSHSIFGNNQNLANQQERPTSTTATQTLQSLNNLNSNSFATNQSCVDNGGIKPAAVSIASRLRTRHTNLSQVIASPNTSISLFDNSQIALLRDEMAIQQANEKRSGRPRSRATVVRPSKVDLSIANQANAVCHNETSQMSGVKAVTRIGRPVKSPNKFWKGSNGTKLNNSVQSTINMTNRKLKVNLNDSITLRNNKVIKKTPPVRNTKAKASSTPLTTITENEKLPEKTKRPQAKKKSPTQEDKENQVVQKKRLPKKQNQSKNNSTDGSVEESSKAKTAKPRNKAQPKEVKAKPAAKKPVKKRKSNEINETLSKKKKVEETIESDLDISCGDELFGINMYTKSKFAVHQVVSPTTGMLSAKKAAGVALSKETPPCKIMSQLMNSSIRSGSNVSSAVKEGPVLKADKVVKRVGKKVENRANKITTSKPAQKKADKDDSKLQKLLDDALKTTYSAVTPLTTTKNSVFLRMEEESGESEDDFDEDDDLI